MPEPTHPATPTSEDLARCESTLREAVDLVLDQGANDEQLHRFIRFSGLIRSAGMSIALLLEESAKLQRKAQAKLGEGLWWCNVRSLAQATPAQVAHLKSSWLGQGTAFDGCCGIGSDTLAILRSRERSSPRVTAVDQDPLMVAICRENIRLNRGGAAAGIDARCGDVGELEIGAGDWLHLDPDRRSGEGRKIRPEDYSPEWGTVERLAGDARGAVVKLAPAADLTQTLDGVRAWVSLSRSVREQTWLVGESIDLAARSVELPLAAGARVAIVLKRSGQRSGYASSDFDHRCPQVTKPGDWMIDPDAAIRAAGLTDAFALDHELSSLGGPAGFLTGEQPVNAALAVAEAVVWSGASDDRKLRKTLRQLDAYPSRVKTRGVGQDPNQLEKRYRECGQQPMTLWIGKAGKRQYAVLTRNDAASEAEVD